MNRDSVKAFFLQAFSWLSKQGVPKQRASAGETQIHLEARYWPEVIAFMERMTRLVKENTTQDPNIQQVNQRILDYVLAEINTKGEIADVDERYEALQILADRILTKSLPKIAGRKPNLSTHAVFSEAVIAFKLHLHERYLKEKLTENHQGNNQAKNTRP